MKVRVDTTKCSGHARCNAVSAELFPLDDIGYSTLQPRSVTPAELDTVVEGVESCPEHALILEDD